MRRLCIIICCLFLIGCATTESPQLKPVVPFPPKQILNVQIDTNTIPVINVGKPFTSEEAKMAYYASMFVNSLAGSAFKPDFSKYYWTDSLGGKYYGITEVNPIGGRPRLILINKNIFPKKLSNGAMELDMLFKFGVTLNHEWCHYHHLLPHPQVQMICDWPARVGLQKFKETNGLTDP